MKELVSNNIASIEAQEAESQKVMTRAEIQDMYGSELEGNPSVYCGTYGKYNNGSLFGLWLDITKFNDYDEFIDVCRQLHADEEDPENYIELENDDKYKDPDPDSFASQFLKP